MHDAGGVRRRERIGDLDAVVECLLQAKPVSRNRTLERAPGTNSIAMKSMPSCWVMSWMVTIPG